MRDKGELDSRLGIGPSLPLMKTHNVKTGDSILDGIVNPKPVKK
jgi:hypothetical protein